MRASLISLFLVLCVASHAVLAIHVGGPIGPLLRRNLTGHVSTLIGTGGNGWGVGSAAMQTQVPFGCMRLGPDNSLGLEPFRLVYDDMNGYFYANDWIDAFSHTHLVGAGIADLQNIGFMPTRKLDNDIIRNMNYRSRYSHDDEVALPGYYAVNLQTPNVYAEMTVSGTHAGVHRYTYRNVKANEPVFLLLDICYGSPKGVISIGGACKVAQISSITIESGIVTVEGFVFTSGSFAERSPIGGIMIYFSARIELAANSGTSANFTDKMWMNKEVLNQTEFVNTTSHSLGAAIGITPSADYAELIVQARIGISFISPENARGNLQHEQIVEEAGGWVDFETLAQNTVDAWENVLQRVAVSGGAAESDYDMKVFYSAMYRAHQAPTTYSEYNGEYLSEDYKVRTIASGMKRYVSDLSIWDIYRTQAPLMGLTAPTLARDMTNSMMIMYNTTGKLPKWVLANVETGCMVGLHSAIVMADSVIKGVGGVDAKSILSAIVAGLAQQNKDLDQYGYLPLEKSSRGSSETLDYSIDAAAAKLLADFLGDNATAESMRPYAQAYRNVFDKEHSFVFPRYSNGTFKPVYPNIPYFLGKYFTEGNAAQYRWYVPQNVPDLISLFPSKATAAQELFNCLHWSVGWTKSFNTTLPNWAFWPGNEPDLLIPYVFSYIGNEFAYLTADWVSDTLDRYYTPYASGLPGNDDYGTMSAWAVFSYWGLYPVASTADYILSAPRFDDVQIRLPTDEIATSPFRQAGSKGGSSSVILRLVAHGRPAKGPAYLMNATVNGVPLATPILTQAQLLSFAAGGPARIDFFLAGEPVVYGQAPPSQGGPKPFAPKSTPAPPPFLETAKMSPEELRVKAQEALRNRRNGKF